MVLVDGYFIQSSVLYIVVVRLCVMLPTLRRKSPSTKSTSDAVVSAICSADVLKVPLKARIVVDNPEQEDLAAHYVARVYMESGGRICTGLSP